MEKFIYWASLPSKLQMKILKRTTLFDLIRCRWTCQGMKQIVFNKEFQAKYCKRHGPIPSKFLFDVYLPGKNHIVINVHATRMLIRQEWLPTNSTCNSMEPSTTCHSVESGNEHPFHIMTIPNPGTVRYQPPPGAPAEEDALPEPQVMALPVFGGPAPPRLAPPAAPSSRRRVRRRVSRKPKVLGNPEDEKHNHLICLMQPPNYHTDRDMYNSFYQLLFGSKDPIEVINLGDSDA